MDRASRIAAYLALASGAVGTASISLLSGDRGWWALGMTLMLTGWALCLFFLVVWLVVVLVLRRRQSGLPRRADRPNSTAGATGRRPTVTPALPESVKRAEIERLTEQLLTARNEREKLQADLRRMEFRLSAVRERVTPLDYVRLGHWRVLDAEYRNTMRNLSEYIRALDDRSTR